MHEQLEAVRLMICRLLGRWPILVTEKTVSRDLGWVQLAENTVRTSRYSPRRALAELLGGEAYDARVRGQIGNSGKYLWNLGLM